MALRNSFRLRGVIMPRAQNVTMFHEGHHFRDPQKFAKTVGHRLTLMRHNGLRRWYASNANKEKNKEFATSDDLKAIAALFGRILAACSLAYMGREYGLDLTACEGPSMMPTIQPSGEIILIEKISHRIYGIFGGNNGEQRAKDARIRQKEWEKIEHKQWLGKSKRRDTYIPKWYEAKLPQATHENHGILASFSKSWARFTSGIDIGDVVVLQHPDKDGTVCKRVVGLPGDIVLQPNRRSYFSDSRQVMDVFDDGNGGGNGDERNDNNSLSSSSNLLSLNNSSLTVIPDGHLWVEGDNSLNSADSRVYGAVSANLVVGKVWMRIWPLRGNALMVRGDRPIPKKGRFTGSTIVPAGSEGETQTIL